MGKLRPGHWLVPQRVARGTESPGLWYFMPVPFGGLLETPLPEEQSGLANGVFCFFSFSFPGLGRREKGEGGEWFGTVV